MQQVIAGRPGQRRPEPVDTGVESSAYAAIASPAEHSQEPESAHTQHGESLVLRNPPY